MTCVGDVMMQCCGADLAVLCLVHTATRVICHVYKYVLFFGDDEVHVSTDVTESVLLLLSIVITSNTAVLQIRETRQRLKILPVCNKQYYLFGLIHNVVRIR